MSTTKKASESSEISLSQASHLLALANSGAVARVKSSQVVIRNLNTISVSDMNDMTKEGVYVISISQTTANGPVVATPLLLEVFTPSAAHCMQRLTRFGNGGIPSGSRCIFAFVVHWKIISMSVA